jgi:hypothetical protein
MPVWPAWYPGLELRSSHLLGLEEFLFARSTLERFSHGVDDFDARQGLEVKRDQGDLRLRLVGGRGLTPSGLPVVASPDRPLETTIAGAPAPTCFVDLVVDLNAPDARESKQRLQALLVGARSPAFDVSGHPDALYFGRIRIHQLDEPVMVARPFVRTLAACRPHDAGWHEWVRPVTDVLKSLHAYVEKRARSGGAVVPLQVEAAQLQFEWPVLPLHVLASRLEYARWLKSHASAPDGPPDPRLAVPRFPPALATGDELPELLARLLEPRASTPVKDVLASVLDRVYLRVPLAEFREWRAWIAQPDLVTDLDAVVAAIEARPQQPRFERWTRAAGLLTIHAFEQARLVDWPRNTISPYLEGTGGTDVASGFATTLDQLLLGEAAQWPAGPLGFFELASAAARSTDLVAVSSPDVRAYMSGVVRRALDPRMATATNRVYAFAAQRVRDPGEAVSPISGVVMIGSRRRRAETADVDLQLVVIGTRGSGKTSVTRALHRASTDGSAPVLPVRLTFKPHPILDAADGGTGGTSLLRFDGRIEGAAGRSGRFTITEIGPDAVATNDPAIVPALAAAHTVIVCLDAALLDRSERPVAWFEQIDKAIGAALQGRPDVQIALAFTKADEYGDVDHRSLRIFSRLEEVVLLERLRDASPAGTDTAWRHLVEGVSLGARFGDAWGETRRRVLEQTQEIWTALIRGRQHLAVNGYFIAAEPIDSYFTPWARRGVLQLFADTLSAAGIGPERTV